MGIHNLKIKSEYFNAVLDGSKKFELRFNDRDFKVGDVLSLNEIDDSGNLTGHSVSRTVTYILHGPCYGLQEGYCILSMEPFVKI